MNAAIKPNPTGAGVKHEDAIALLTADHKVVKGLFAEFTKLKDHDRADTKKAALVKQVCDALKVHAEIEEEIFYPAVRKAIDDGDLMDEALVEHSGAKDLIAQLEDMNPEDDLYDAKVTVLSEQIEHHVKEEEGDMFVKAKAAKVDVVHLGAQMADRKAHLIAEQHALTAKSSKSAAHKKTSAHRS